MCDKCGCEKHIGVCGADREVQGVMIQCVCLVATPSSLNRRELRVRDVLHRADIREAERLDWEQKTPQEQRRIRNHVPYRRM